VRMLGPSPRERQELFQKVSDAIELIGERSPVYLRRLRRDLRGIWINLAAGNVAEYHDGARLCLLDRQHLSKSDVTESRVAAMLVHETTHARLAKSGINYEPKRRSRIEAVCYRAEIRFAGRLSDGGAIAEQARLQMQQDPIRWSAEAARARARDRFRELGVPEWLIRFIVRAIPAD